MISEIGKQAQRGVKACLSPTAVLWIELGFESVDEFFFFFFFGQGDRSGCLLLRGLSLVAASRGHLLIVAAASLVAHEL